MFCWALKWNVLISSLLRFEIYDFLIFNMIYNIFIVIIVIIIIKVILKVDKEFKKRRKSNLKIFLKWIFQNKNCHFLLLLKKN
jgi:hypothetical protein